MTRKYIIICLYFTVFSAADAVELVIGEERVSPVIVFEGAVKDHVLPLSMHLAEDETHVHIEARVNWDETDIPEGTPLGGFIPYLRVNAKVRNQKTGLSTFIDLLPHINLIDNFHYAGNISFPGSICDSYSVDFTVAPPTHSDLALHRDWVVFYGDALMKSQVSRYRDVNFEEIAKASRR